MLKKVITLEVTAVAIQQTLTQTSMGMSMLKQQAQASQSLVNVIQQAASNGSRGQNVDVIV